MDGLRMFRVLGREDSQVARAKRLNVEAINVKVGREIKSRFDRLARVAGVSQRVLLEQVMHEFVEREEAKGVRPKAEK